MAAAKEVRVDAAIVEVFQNWMVFSLLKKKNERLFLMEHVVSLPTGFGKPDTGW